MLSNSSVLATESTSNLQEEKTMEVDKQQQSGKDQSEANNNEVGRKILIQKIVCLIIRVVPRTRLEIILNPHSDEG